MKTMTAEKLVGLRIAEARRKQEWTQRELGEQLEDLLGAVWGEQAVSDAETGRRKLDPTELLAFALTLGRHPAWFLQLRGGEAIEIGDKRIGPRKLLQDYAVPGLAVYTEVLLDGLQGLQREVQMLYKLADEGPEGGA